MKVLPLIEFLTQYGIQDMKYFTHRSERCRQEIFLAIGQVLKSQLVKATANGHYFFLLSEEVCDIAVTEQFLTFVQYASDAQVQTKFLSVQNLLEHHSSANSDAMVDKLQWGSFTGLASDGASVFTGSKNGAEKETTGTHR